MEQSIIKLMPVLNPALSVFLSRRGLRLVGYEAWGKTQAKLDKFSFVSLSLQDFGIHIRNNYL